MTTKELDIIEGRCDTATAHIRKLGYCKWNRECGDMAIIDTHILIAEVRRLKSILGEQK